MATIHMQTDTVRDTARQVAQAATRLRAEARALSQQLQYLERNWQGPSSATFMADADYRIATLRRLAQEGAELAGRMMGEVEAWEAMDRLAGS